jgi:lipooligosaccharide transport system ATP-binding protein
VVEVFGEHAAAWAKPCARHAQRFEVRPKRCLLRDDAQPLLRDQQHPQLRYLHRPSNLEDVFLKLTGREMRE